MLRPWELVLKFERVAHIALHVQIAEAIVNEIRHGRLVRGNALPGARVLAEVLDVNRKTVSLAYDELKAQGWVSSQTRRGTFVSADVPRSALTAEDVQSGGARFRMAAEAAVINGCGTYPGARAGPGTGTYTGTSVDTCAVTYAQTDRPSNASARTDVVASAHANVPEAPRRKPAARAPTEGDPDTRLIPFAVLSRAFHRTIVTMTRGSQLGYGDARGAPALRAAIATMLRMERGLDIGADNVCLVRGSQMGIFLAARLLTRPGDCVVFESLSYPPARAAFASCGAQVLQVAHDAEGPLLDALETLCGLHRVRAIFVTPHHQFPTTVTMTAARRAGLLALAERFDFSIIEDDYDHEFHFEARAPLPLAHRDPAGRVWYVGSLSKVLAPGLRLGYLIASRETVERCADEIMLIDRQGNALTELAVADLMGTGELRRHILRARHAYRGRRDHAVSAIRKHFDDDVDFDVPAGGLALWIRLHSRIDIDAFEQEARRQGISLLTSRLFAGDGHAEPAFRLGYGSLDEAELDGSIATLRRASRR